MISSKVLEKILNIKDKLYDIKQYENTVVYTFTEESFCYDEINIFELADRCIEQAEKLGYSIIAISDFDLRHCAIEEYKNYWFTAYVNMNLFPELNKKETHLYDVSEETRPKAIISAFEWILENKDEK